MGRVKSATVIETIIAAVIILVLFIIVNGVFLNVRSGTATLTNIEAKKLIDLYVAKATALKQYTDFTENNGAWQIQQNVVEVINNKAIKLRFVIAKNGKIIEQQERIFLVE